MPDARPEPSQAAAADVHVRRATEADVDFLAGVILEANRARLSKREGWDPERWHSGAREIVVKNVAGETPDSTSYVVELAGERVGRLRIVRPGEQIYLAGLQILPPWQGQGIGMTVVGMVREEAEAAGLPLRLDVEKDNPDARRLYLRLGFRVIEEREDREVMEAEQI